MVLTKKTTQATFSLKAGDIRKDWHVLDAAGQPLGRVAAQAAALLRGKHKPTFTPHLDAGDSVIIINADKVKITGQKLMQKTYYRHSGYPGGLKAETLGRLLERRPVRVTESAVRGMLPHNRLGRAIFKHLHVYGGPDHPHQAQVGNGKKESE